VLAVQSVSAPASESGAGDRTRVRVTAMATADIRPEIFQLAHQAGWTLYELHQESGSLEDLFRDLTAAAPVEAA
jgi:hypothetical protein